MIAAETSSRICLGIELDPRYVDVAVRRWEAFTEKEAILEASGQTFAEVAAERAAESHPPDDGKDSPTNMETSDARP